MTGAPIVADTYLFVVGVDTHAATHHYAIIDTRTGGIVDDAEFPTNTKGLLRAAAWVTRRTGEPTKGDLDRVLVSIEGTRSYGAQIAALMAQAGYRVVDAPSPKRERGTGKNDTIDAVVAARGTLHKRLDQLADARAGDTSTTLQILLTARAAMTSERTRMVNALNALLRTHALGVDARKKVNRPTIRVIAAWRVRKSDTLALATARAEAIRLATRVVALDSEVDANEQALLEMVTDTHASLLDLPGLGPTTAAVVLAAWSHPGRVRDEAAFAKLAGVSPLEVASGNRHEHRLNRTGDRQLNSAFHTIASSRMRHDERTRDYVARRTAQGLSKRRIRRCLKRYVAREIYRHLAAEGVDNP
ncbi:IS110 family transposase [Nocardioides nitrophenolicus]|uniref:IS110 family transposase n=1 Tax=Nocardioides nitrophenolicus TaxID=60489 RepID=UPI001957FB32|nr:IS110 family transposase [Nocardioides nitrophenolicus]MBM7516373.1 transposase [Nocardioides nitrophenolicus]